MNDYSINEKVMKKNIIIAVCFCLLMGTAAMADTVDSLTFKLDSWKDYKKIKEESGIDAALKFVFTAADPGFVYLTFDLTDVGYDMKLNFGDQGVKFKDFGITGFDNTFSTPLTPIDGWSNGGWTPTSATFKLAMDDMTWDDFINVVTAENFNGSVMAHIQSLYINNNEYLLSDSINGAVFKYAPIDTSVVNISNDPDGDEFSPVPEPGSILLLGTGVAGLGLVARCKERNRH